MTAPRFWQIIGVRMWFSGMAVDIACFAEESSGAGDVAAVAGVAAAAKFEDRYSLVDSLARLGLGSLSFTAEVGLREAFAHPIALREVVPLLIETVGSPRLCTTARYFVDRDETARVLREVAGDCTLRVVLRVNDREADAMPEEAVRHLVRGCRETAIDLRLEFEAEREMTESFLRAACTVEEEMFTVTLLPMRARPVISIPQDGAIPWPRGERLQLVIDGEGDVSLRQRTPDRFVDVSAGSLREQPLDALLARFRAREKESREAECFATTR